MSPGLPLVLLLVLCGSEGSEPDPVRRAYRSLAENVPPENALRHYQIGLWCLEKGLTAEMFHEFDLVLRAEPAHPRLHRTLEQLQGTSTVAGLAPEAEACDQAEAWIAIACGRSLSKALLAEMAIADLPREAVLEALHRCLKSPRREVRRHAVRRFRDYPGHEDSAALAARALADEDAEVRAAAAETLRETAKREATAIFCQVLAHPKPAARIYAAEALGVLREPRAVDFLIEALRVAQGGGGGVSGPRAYAFFGSQKAYVRDYDVQIATAAAIAKPVIGLLQTASVIDVRILGVTEEVTIGLERRILRDSLVRIIGADAGDSAEQWAAWWETHRR